MTVQLPTLHVLHLMLSFCFYLVRGSPLIPVLNRILSPSKFVVSYTLAKYNERQTAGNNGSRSTLSCLSDNYTASQKNDTDVAHYNFNAHQPIFVIFGRDVSDRVRYRSWFVISPLLTNVSAVGKHEPRKLSFQWQWQTWYSTRPPTSSDRNEILRGVWSSGGSCALGQSCYGVSAGWLISIRPEGKVRSSRGSNFIKIDQAVSELWGSKFVLSHWFDHWLIQNRNLAANGGSNSKRTWEIK